MMEKVIRGQNAFSLNMFRTEKELQEKEELRKAFETFRNIYEIMIEEGFDENFIAKVMANILRGE